MILGQGLNFVAYHEKKRAYNCYKYPPLYHFFTSIISTPVTWAKKNTFFEKMIPLSISKSRNFHFWKSEKIHIYTTASHDNWDLILSEVQNQFCACSEHPRKKCESGFLFNTNMPAALRVRGYIIVKGKDTMF